MPTDTVYGIAADPRIPGAEQRLRQAKGSAADKPIPLLVADRAQIEQWPAQLNGAASALAQQYWPGALTMVLATGHNTAAQGAAPTGWEGFRIPKHAVALAILRAAGGALRVTSANPSGAPPALTAPEAAERLGAAAELVLDAGAAPGGRPSSVVKIEDQTITILREGYLLGPKLQWLDGGHLQRRAAQDADRASRALFGGAEG